MQNVDFANGYKKPKTKTADLGIGDVSVYEEPAKKSTAYNAYAAAANEQYQMLVQQQELAERQRRAAMDATIKANNQAADKSLREAYVANMMAQKNMPQQLKAAGISGGASETTMADVHNTYMNNRFGIEEARNNANAQARQAYDAGVAGDYSNYLTEAYKLKGTMADKAAAGTQKQTGEQPAVKGYKVESMGITASDEVELYLKLMEGGLTQEQAEQYLIQQGLVQKQSAGGSYR